MIFLLRVFVVVNDVCNESSEDIMDFKVRLHIAHIHKIVHALQRINDVHLIVIMIILEIPICYLL